MKEKASRELANGQNIDYSEKENGPRASSAPALGLNTIIFKHVYWYMLQISGKRLQDHWSSGLIGKSVKTNKKVQVGEGQEKVQSKKKKKKKKKKDSLSQNRGGKN